MNEKDMTMYYDPESGCKVVVFGSEITSPSKTLMVVSEEIHPNTFLYDPEICLSGSARFLNHPELDATPRKDIISTQIGADTASPTVEPPAESLVFDQKV